MAEEFTGIGGRRDLDALSKRKIELSPEAQIQVDRIVDAISAEDFEPKYSHRIGFSHSIQALRLGLKYPRFETRKDMFGDGNEMLAVKIPLLRHEAQEGMNALVDFRTGRGEESLVMGLKLENYRMMMANNIHEVLSDIARDDIPYGGDVASYEV